MKIAIIGAGNMGGAFYQGLAKIFSRRDLMICDRDVKKLTALKKTGSSNSAFLKNFSTDANKIVVNADIIILAVKPQSFAEFCENLNASLQQKFVISIMAGVSIATIKKNLNTSKIVRSMPNLPAQVGHGMTGWIATPQVSSPQKKLVSKIFSSLGTAMELRKEKDIDVMTALSGSGPAYFFYLCEMLAIKAGKLGFSQEKAKEIAQSTFIGAAKLLEKNSLSAEEWKKAVTSKGGTTEAALNYLYAHNFEKIFHQAIEKAKDRATELGGK